MNFPPYWARGEYDGFLTWRWSSQSLAEAQSLADDAAQKIAERFREQVLREIKDAAGEIYAVITRNDSPISKTSRNSRIIHFLFFPCL